MPREPRTKQTARKNTGSGASRRPVASAQNAVHITNIISSTNTAGAAVLPASKPRKKQTARKTTAGVNPPPPTPSDFYPHPFFIPQPAPSNFSGPQLMLPPSNYFAYPPVALPQPPNSVKTKTEPKPKQPGVSADSATSSPKKTQGTKKATTSKASTARKPTADKPTAEAPAQFSVSFNPPPGTKGKGKGKNPAGGSFTVTWG